MSCNAPHGGVNRGYAEETQQTEGGRVTADPIGYESLPEEPDPSLDELLREAGSRPVENIHDLAVDGFFESDEELDEFLHFYHEQRQSGVS
jgi:hypothetical protein